MSDLLDRVVIPETKLSSFTHAGDLAERARWLLKEQKSSWVFLRNCYTRLAGVKTRLFEVAGSVVRVQFNPGRLTSTAAKVDEESIKERKCFLCPQNLPHEQRGLLYEGQYLILCNPFPIFPEHFTISQIEHTPQRILPSFGTLLSLSRDLGKRYTVIYNGPKCGASAPDHMHFQSGSKSLMPIEDEFDQRRDSIAEKIFEGDRLRAYIVRTSSRRFVGFESSEEESLVRAFGGLYETLQKVGVDDEEPMMNIISSYTGGQWRMIIFPRAKHRPSFFFEEGEKRILLSPAAVDLGGVCITPLEKDFEKITNEDLTRMFDEVCLSEPLFRNLTASLKQKLARAEHRS